MIVAGFQNIDDRPAAPDAAPAKASPSPTALCSRMPNTPAHADDDPITDNAAADTATSNPSLIRPVIILRLPPPAQTPTLLTGRLRRNLAQVTHASFLDPIRPRVPIFRALGLDVANAPHTGETGW